MTTPTLKEGAPFRHRGHTYEVASVGFDKTLGVEAVTVSRRAGSAKGDGAYRAVAVLGKDGKPAMDEGGEPITRIVYDGTLKQWAGCLVDVRWNAEKGWFYFNGCEEPRTDGQLGIAQYDIPGAQAPKAEE